MTPRDPYTPWRLWALAALVFILLPIACHQANAEARFIARSGTAVIVLHDEPCALPAVTNLLFRATWLQDGKLNEGCWSPSAVLPVVMMYFDDKTVAVAPVQAFEKANGT
jgi:hypothetical protein